MEIMEIQSKYDDIFIGVIVSEYGFLKILFICID